LPEHTHPEDSLASGFKNPLTLSFFGALVVGIAAELGNSALLAVGAMAAYFLFGLTRSKSVRNTERFADRLYYLGFILTLGALFIAMNRACAAAHGSRRQPYTKVEYVVLVMTLGSSSLGQPPVQLGRRANMASHLSFVGVRVGKKFLRHRERRPSHRAFASSITQILAAASLAAALVVIGQSPQAAMQRPRQWGYIDKSGHYVIAQQFDSAGQFSEGLAPIRRGDKYGFIDMTGKIVIAPQFENTQYGFHEGRAKVEIAPGKWAFIDRAGKLYGPATGFDEAAEFHEGLAAVEIKDKWAFIDPSGAFAIPPRIEQTWAFNEGLAPFRAGKKWGFIDRRGNPVIRPQFDYAYGFSEGLAQIEVNQKWGYIDRAGRMVIEANYALAGDFHDGIARVAPEWGSGWGYIDKANRAVVPAIYPDAGDFHEGLAQVAIRGDFGGNTWGFINKSGTMVIAARFSHSRQFSEGLAGVDGGFVDQKGAPAIAQRFLDTGDFTEGLAPVADFIPPGG
jgi:hypothetical protein